MPKINVALLGTTGAGKTCLTASMYHELRVGKDNFLVSAQKSDDDKDLNRAWNVMRSSRGPERFPPGTDDLRTFPMHLDYAFQRILSFDWIDYPGATIFGSDDEEMKVGLQKFLSDAAGIVICLPADHLFSYLEDDAEALELMCVGDINRMIAKLQHRFISADRPTVVVAVTKFDLFVKKVDEGNQKEMWDDLIRRYFSDATELERHLPAYKLLLLEAIVRDAFQLVFAPAGGWEIAIVPITLGMALADQGESCRLSAENVQLPLLYIARSRLEAWLPRISYLEAISKSAKGHETVPIYREIYALPGSPQDVATRELAEKWGNAGDAIRSSLKMIASIIPHDLSTFSNGERKSGPSALQKPTP